MADDTRDTIDELDYYALLEIEPEASESDIKEAFHAFARKYHPDQYPAGTALADRAARIYRRGTEAYRVLTRPQARELYDRARAETSSPPESRPAPKKDRARESLRPPAIAAERDPLEREADKAIGLGNYLLAKRFLISALQLNPDNEELQAKFRVVKEKLGES
jgi:curved DNA-binding protein CbpA